MYISKDLKDLVSQSIKLLGVAIKEVYGDRMYEKIENLRLRMKDVRAKESDLVKEAMEEVYLELKTSKNKELHHITTSFALMLELINTCEAAYRSFRLEDTTIPSSKKPHSLVYVFTSHPTEARSRDFLLLMNKIETLLLEALSQEFSAIEGQLFYLLRIALRIDLANNKRPQVKDEAQQIYHTVLDQKIVKEQIYLKRKGINVFFRTWVGGDKDGHPGVGPATMLQSLDLSRQRLSKFIIDILEEYKTDIRLMGQEHQFIKICNDLVTELKTLRKIKIFDGKKVSAFKKNVLKLTEGTKKKNMFSPGLSEIEELLWLYPALVLPLEIREDQERIHRALKTPSLAIAKMLTLVKKISSGMDAKWYVRGFVISMCQTTEDLIAAVELTKKMTGSLTIPVVPLFENEKGLRNAVEILKEGFKQFDFVKDHSLKWGGRFEVMLGYSDSSKENGVLPGRLLIEKALLNLEKFFLKEKLTPVFFHGSGGSVSRGGGSIKEQIAWWPQTALNIYKVTIQGEMVQRHFHQPLIMRSQVRKIVEEFANYRPLKLQNSAAMTSFTEHIQNSYRTLVQDSSFQNLSAEATPYEFLNLLKIGSRPASRSGKGKFTLRAIPWILCWTQVRLLLPVWWGAGTAWKKMVDVQKDEIRNYYRNSPLMQSYVKHVGFTLAKIELGVWEFHLQHTKLSTVEKKKWKELIRNEIYLTTEFFNDITNGESFTWYRPRLGESIFFRSSMIHPLNVIQKIALERSDNVLLRETVTGIACGMLTTG